MIVDMYEDIAVLNGYEFAELKSQWDVIREKYRYNQKQTNDGVENLELDKGQLLLFDESDWA